MPLILVLHGDGEDLAEPAIAAVVVATASTGFAVTTGGVLAELQRTGHEDVGVHDLDILLRTLAREPGPQAALAHPSWHERRIEKLDEETPGRRRRVFWRLAGSTYPAPGLFAPTASDDLQAYRHQFTHADCVRVAFAETRRALQRPVDLREVRLWAGWIEAKGDGAPAPERAAADAALGPGFRKHLIQTVQRDSARIPGVGMMRPVRTPHSMQRRVERRPLRMTTEEVTQAEIAACVLEDLPDLLRPTAELREIDDLLRVADDVGSEMLGSIARTRRALLRSVVLSYAPAGADAVQWLRAGLECALRARAAITELCTTSAIPARIRHAASAVKSPTSELELLVEHAGEAPGARIPALQSIVTYDAVPLQSCRGFAKEVAVANELTGRFWWSPIRESRRVKARLRCGISSREPGDTDAFVDRPDVIIECCRACSAPTMSALVNEGSAVLGLVLRDHVAMLKWLAAAPRGDSYARRGITVALGLLGLVPPIELVCPDRGDPEDAEAYLAAVALGCDDKDERVRLAEHFDAGARGAAAEVSEGALMRIEDGWRIGALD